MAEQRQERPRSERGSERGGERGEGRRERGERRPRGERRDERGPREAAAGAEATEVSALAGSATSVGVVPDLGDQAPGANAVLESHTHQDGLRSEPAGEERRDRRSRDRYGRDRRERGDRQPRDEAAAPSEQPLAAQPGDMEPQERTPRYPTGFVTDEAEAVQPAAPQSAPAFGAAPAAPASTQVPAAPVRREPAAAQPAVAQPAAAQPAAAAAPSRGLPKVRPFDLPVDQLIQVAEGSGLQWVNSDAQKIAAVQAAIAAEPKPARVPRERPPAVVLDEGPLVLVETRRDLRDMKLPFEQTTLPLQ